MTRETPVVLITPSARETLAAEVERGQSGVSGGLIGGLLFGHPLDEDHRLVVSAIRLSSDVGFGRRDFSLDQTRTSRQLDQARELDPQADYCGVWYLHRTPNRELTSEEWDQTQILLEDPDFRFDDLVCLVLCFYGAELKFHAASFNRTHSARGQAPAPTQMRLSVHRSIEMQDAAPATTGPRPAWYKAPEVVARLNKEREQLDALYKVEVALAPNEQMIFRLTPREKYEKLVFFLACGSGFPKEAPRAFLPAGDKPYPVASPGLGNWSQDQPLTKVAEELLGWMAFSVDEYLEAGREALEQGDYQRAEDLLTVVLVIEPRTPGAPRLLARAQART